MNQLDEILAKVRDTCASPRVVLLGGGNFSIKNDDGTMLIKGSGSQLATLTERNMVLVGREILQESIDYAYDSNPFIREEQHEQFRIRAKRNPEDSMPSIEAPVHHLFPQKYVLHTHPTAFTALSAIVEAEELTRKLLGTDIMVVDYCDPGIILGKDFARMLSEGKYTPKGLMQRNHGFFFASDDFDKLIAFHDHAVKTVQEYTFQERIHGFS